MVDAHVPRLLQPQVLRVHLRHEHAGATARRAVDYPQSVLVDGQVIVVVLGRVQVVVAAVVQRPPHFHRRQHPFLRQVVAHDLVVAGALVVEGATVGHVTRAEVRLLQIMDFEDAVLTEVFPVPVLVEDFASEVFRQPDETFQIGVHGIRVLHPSAPERARVALEERLSHHAYFTVCNETTAHSVISLSHCTIIKQCDQEMSSGSVTGVIG